MDQAARTIRPNLGRHALLSIVSLAGVLILTTSCARDVEPSVEKPPSTTKPTFGEDAASTTWYGSPESQALSASLFEGLAHPCTGRFDRAASAELVEGVAEPDVRDSLGQVINRLTWSEEDCDNIDQWRERSPAAVLALIEASNLIAEDLGEAPHPEVTRAQLDARRPNEYLSDLAAAYDLLDWNLAGQPNVLTYRNRLWTGNLGRGNAAEVFGLRDSYQTLVTGSVKTWYGIDPAMLSDASGTDSLVLATPGASVATAHKLATESLTTLVDVKKVVIAVSPTDFLANSDGDCTDFAQKEATEAGAERATAFTGVADGLGIWHRHFVTRSDLIESPFFIAFDTAVEERTTIVPDAVFDRRLERAAPPFRQWTVCEDKFNVLADSIEAFDPATVSLLVMPVHPSLLDEAPDGDTQLAELVAAIVDAADGAPVIDYSGEFTPDAFRDPSNLLPKAALELTTKLAAEL